ncbi:hypothetical protein Lal_00028029 [Lupinus albus]|uniref:Putative CLASP domain-containing protein n=1 Tax=Lupinus albus TaxID=3870 RepID=A0A6A5LF88_LUPAL|nr:putative CLASP domain-containing protein [Lupinus albus]KAF1859846.1 hypothetical protein Lal_00028029 [Lupinus albus]
MSENALRDFNTIPTTERKSESSSKAYLTKPSADNADENIEEGQNKNNGSALISPPVNGNQTVTINSCIETGNGIAEVEYIESENLNDLEDVDTCLKNLLAGLDSKDWIVVCDALNNVRRLSLFHKEALLDMLGDVATLVAKSLKNPRSALCKTAIMTSADIFSAYNDLIIDSLDPLLVQLLLKASQDKRFVCEAAEKALVAMTTWISPMSLLPKLQPNLKHRNPRIRAKASMCFSRSVPRLGAEGIKTYGIDKLIQVAASQLSDQLPESREAARVLLIELQNVYQKVYDLMPATTVSEHPEIGSWESFCQSKLSPLSAQAVLRVTSIAREGLVS